MPAFAAIFQRDGRPADVRALARMGDTLEHRGESQVSWSEGTVAMLWRSRRAEVDSLAGELPSLAGSTLLFDGRLDNRTELASTLALDARGRTDSELVLEAYGKWGSDLCQHLLGPFALALFDARAQAWLLARDPLGDRSLFYAEPDGHLILASEESAVTAHPLIGRDLDHDRLVHYFAARVPADRSTFFSGVRELEAGHRLEWDARGTTRPRYWEPPTERLETPHSLDEAAQEYRELLRIATARRLDPTGPSAILMSGGIDSTSLAVTAAELGTRPVAVSWIFDSLPECDERSFMDPLVTTWELETARVLGDDLGPRPGLSSLGRNPNSPEENPYRGLKTAAYQAAREAGCRAVLTGGSADVLYDGYESWFRDELALGALFSPLAALAIDAWRIGPRAAARRAGFRRPRRVPPPAWLLPEAADRLHELSASTETAPAAVAQRAARGISLEVFHAASSGIDLCHPYRDLRLVEFMLRLPARHLYRRGVFKRVARRAVQGKLPRSILERTEPTRLTPLFERSVRGVSAWRDVLDRRDAAWRDYVRAEWVESAFAEPAGPTADVALWNCLAFELWRQ